MLPLQVAHSGADSVAFVYERPLVYSAHDGGPQRRLSQAMGTASVVPTVIPAPRVVPPAARPAPVAEPARKTSVVSGADMVQTWPRLQTAAL